eukprot:XP_001708781.1 Hypothetical protein GL50803_36650 [Giardia lamblia ATCC 50803]
MQKHPLRYFSMLLWSHKQFQGLDSEEKSCRWPLGS